MATFLGASAKKRSQKSVGQELRKRFLASKEAALHTIRKRDEEHMAMNTAGMASKNPGTINVSAEREGEIQRMVEMARKEKAVGDALALTQSQVTAQKLYYQALGQQTAAGVAQGGGLLGGQSFGGGAVGTGGAGVGVEFVYDYQTQKFSTRAFDSAGTTTRTTAITLEELQAHGAKVDTRSVPTKLDIVEADGSGRGWCTAHLEYAGGDWIIVGRTYDGGPREDYTKTHARKDLILTGKSDWDAKIQKALGIYYAESSPKTEPPKPDWTPERQELYDKLVEKISKIEALLGLSGEAKAEDLLLALAERVEEIERELENRP